MSYETSLMVWTLKHFFCFYIDDMGANLACQNVERLPHGNSRRTINMIMRYIELAFVEICVKIELVTLIIQKLYSELKVS